ncbi:MAG: outer membrane beta-barrel protein [Verrucomicrobiota bacterium]|nr:outer membrane beta-barrel protein [Verrucomicrobiota bacterium]
MKNKFSFLISFLAASLCYWINVFSASAAPLVSIGDNTDIYFNGSSSLRWSSNIFRNEDNKESDLSWTVSPGLEINLGRGISNADFTIITRYDLVSYQDNDQLDTELFHIEALGTYESSRLDVNGSASYDETKINTEQNNVQDDLVELNTTSSELDAEYQFSPKFSFSAGVRYDETEYQTYADRFADREVTRFPFSVYYELTPKLDLILGYTYATSDIEGTSSSFLSGFDPVSQAVTEITDVIQTGYEKDSHFYNVGLRGNISSKLTGYFKIGYRTRSPEDSIIFSTPTDVTNPANPLVGATTLTTIDRDNSGMLGLDVDLTWMATTKLLVQLALSRDFETGGEGESIEATRANLVGNYSFNTNWSTTANLGYSETDYTDNGREDEQFTGGLRIMYVLNSYWRFSAGYNYTKNDSTRANSSYESEILDLTAILRY